MKYSNRYHAPMRRKLACVVALAASCSLSEVRKPKSMLELRGEGCNLQSHEYSCGAAAIATLMNIFGEPATEKEIIDIVFKDKKLKVEGDKVIIPELTIEDLENASRAKGFKVISLQALSGGEAINTIQKLKPVIARLKLHKDYPHFVVIRDIQDEWVAIMDPAYGNFNVPVSMFYKNWEAGDKYVVTVSRNAFYAWESEDGEQVFVKRNDKDVFPEYRVITPQALYDATERNLTRLNYTR